MVGESLEVFLDGFDVCISKDNALAYFFGKLGDGDWPLFLQGIDVYRVPDCPLAVLHLSALIEVQRQP